MRRFDNHTILFAAIGLVSLARIAAILAGLVARNDDHRLIPSSRTRAISKG